MLNINGTNIILTRGDTAYIEIPVFEADGTTPYLVTADDTVTLQDRRRRRVLRWDRPFHRA